MNKQHDAKECCFLLSTHQLHNTLERDGWIENKREKVEKVLATNTLHVYQTHQFLAFFSSILYLLGCWLSIVYCLLFKQIISHPHLTYPSLTTSNSFLRVSKNGWLFVHRSSATNITITIDLFQFRSFFSAETRDKRITTWTLPVLKI